MKEIKLIGLVLIIVFFTNCNHETQSGYANDEVMMDFEVHEEAMEMVPATIMGPPAPPSYNLVNDSEQITRKVIKNGLIEFESEDIGKSYNAISTMLKRFDAYIENEEEYKYSQTLNYNVTIRVPADKYDSLFSQLLSSAGRLLRKQSNVEDVTERYYDLKTRLKNKKVLEGRYLEILKKTNKISEILEIESKLAELRSEIENLEGKFRYLSKQVNYSTIQLIFHQDLPYEYIPEKNIGFGEKLMASFGGGWKTFLSFTLGVFRLWPFILIMVIMITLIRKYRFKFSRSKK
ncbi:DUF4349 domain-containing protein [Marinigracilibium pacificum]|uniref:DUF4349 domain-containing protein n=1 Tax=Marinigracilibium pacificum TaxID=2729599 RepID=A0A848J6C4_9BACT|nr:DUF4349 domain-containing protein [Marinigracilibium pacificum]NMM50070.1 DUF4349 domain-containing protein [Marinigracilibium pacificum]